MASQPRLSTALLKNNEDVARFVNVALATSGEHLTSITITRLVKSEACFAATAIIESSDVTETVESSETPQTT